MRRAFAATSVPPESVRSLTSAESNRVGCGLPHHFLGATFRSTVVARSRI